MEPSSIRQLGVTHQLSNCELTRIDLDLEHYYYGDGEFFVSLTHVLDIGAPFPEGLRQWLRVTDADDSMERLNMAKDRGTKLHNALEGLVKGFELYLADDYPTTYEKDAIVTFIRTMRFLQPTDLRTELIVADPKLKVGGTMDLVGMADKRRLDILANPTYSLEIVDDNFQLKPGKEALLDGDPEPVKFVMDYKFTGRSSYNHKVQVSKYLSMFNESYDKESPATHAYIWRYSPKHKCHFDMKPADYGPSSFNRIYETAIEYLGGFPEPPVLTVYPESVRLFETVKQAKQGAKS
jgi:hypothetical protein